MAILYVETNLPVCIAKGRDRNADGLLASASCVAIAMPCICYMEAISHLDYSQRRTRAFLKTFDEPLDGAGRDSTSADAASFRAHLQESKTAGGNWLNDVRARLYNSLE